MSCSAARRLSLALILAAGGCSRRPTQPGPERIAVLRCENLTADASLDWLGRGFSEMLAGGIATSERRSLISLSGLRSAEGLLSPRPHAAPGISSERQAALLAGANRMVYCRFESAGGKLRLEATVEDPASLKTVREAAAEAPAADIFSLAEAVARQLGPARPFGTRNTAALQAYAQALDAADAASAEQDLARAVAADPNFGGAYVAWVQAALARQDRAAAGEILQKAQGRANALPESDRARLDLESATLRGDKAARVRALAALSRLNPGDPRPLFELAETALAGRRYREAVNYYQRSAEAAPTEVSVLNSLGYAKAFLGDLEGALATLRQYEKLRPAEPNPLDSQADVNCYFGRFAEAERLYLEAHRKDPNFLNGAELLKAAQARLMTGDVPGADALFQQYARAQQARQDPWIDYRAAQWQYLTGRRKQALESLDALAAKMEAKQNPAGAALVRAQEAVWSLALGDPQGARRQALQAVSATKPPPGLAVLAMFLTEPAASPAEWQQRAARLAPQPAQAPLRDLALGYALLFQKQFQAAVPVLRELYEETSPVAEGFLPVLLAWADLASGQYQGVIPLIGPSPIAQSAGLDAFTSLYFPRLFLLRGELADHQGKKDAARQNYELFLKLAGPDAETWGDEARARAALSGSPRPAAPGTPGNTPPAR